MAGERDTVGHVDDELTPLSESLDRVLKGLRGPDRRQVGGLFGRWEEIVGDLVARHVRPVRLEDRVLMVEVDEPGYAETTLSDGTSAQVDENAEVVRVESELTSDELRSGITIYSAGLGFKVNDNITVDALSFANLTNLAYWKLSLAFSVTM